MNTIESTPFQHNAQDILASTVADRIPQMNKEELQRLVENGHLDLQKENAALQERVKHLEEELAILLAENERLMYRISRSLFNEKDYDNFDRREYTVSWEEMLANAKKRLLKP